MIMETKSAIFKLEIMRGESEGLRTMSADDVNPRLRIEDL